MLGELGAHLNTAAATGATPAFIVSQAGHVEVVRVLGELGANLNTATHGGATPAIVASENGHAEVVRVLGELGANLNALLAGCSPLAVACQRGRAEVVRILCINGAARVCPAGAAEELAEAAEILDFLERTRGFLNPLQYSKELTVDEARFWLRSERLRSFPNGAFVHGDSPACNVIKAALVWSVHEAALFPASCRRRARDLLCIRWTQKGLPQELILNYLLPFLIDRWSPVRWSRKARPA